MNDLYKRIKKKIKKENLVYRYFILFVTMLVAAINYNIFLRPLKIAAGGTNGISLIVEEIFGMSPSLFILLFSVIVLIAAYFLVGSGLASSALVSAFVYPLFVQVTSFISDYIVVNQSDIIVASVFSGILSGWVSGFTCKVNLSQGGVTLIDQILLKKFNFSISKTNFIINFVVIIIGGFCFGSNSIFSSIILLFISSKMIDYVMLGISNNKTLYIITHKEDTIRKFITEEIDSGLTIFNVKGGRDDKDRFVFMISISNNLYPYVKRKIKKIDPNIFYAVVDSYQVVGGRTGE